MSDIKTSIPEPPTVALEVRGASKRFGATQALDAASLRVEVGTSHALVGRNGAGKSTLVSLITGLTAPDQGEIQIMGDSAPPITSPAAWKSLVACVYQKPSIVPDLTVAENLFLNRQPLRDGGRIDWRAMRQAAEEEIERWNLEVPAGMRGGDLTLEQRRLLEIARGISSGAPILVLDEPTAELENAEIRRLLERLNSMRAAGATFIFISHHLAEVYELCDAVTVLRNGRTVLADEVSSTPRRRLVDAMVGEDAANRQDLKRERQLFPGALPVLVANDLVVDDAVDGVSLTVEPGEVLGIASQATSGGLQLGPVLAGMRRPVSGEVTVNRRAGGGANSGAANSGTAAMVTHDRHHDGFVPEMSIEENVTLPVLRKLSSAGRINRGARRARARELAARCGIISRGLAQSVEELSGGNQQKAVVARALSADPDLLVLLRPTQGVDVASRDTLVSVVHEWADQGAGVVLISDEIDDLRACDRVLVMFRGRVVAQMPQEWQDGELIAAIEGLSTGEEQ